MKEMRSLGNSRENYWIAKPKNDYGGAGIRVYRGTDPELAKIVRDNDGKKSVVQRYLADPLLIGGYKFHCRIHLVIASLDPLEAYVQENGQVLFATKPDCMSGKTLGSAFDPPVHVTNMTLNATAANKENYFREKPLIGKGQQCRMRELHAYLAEHHRSFDKKELWSQILSIAAEVARYISRAPSLRQHGDFVPNRHFETFGMDLMLDKNLKVYMCETNTDPGLLYPDKKVLDEPNPDYNKELAACRETWHDILTLLGLDAGRPQSKGSLRSWYKVDFSGLSK
jgi:tubulin polyglutamylase TTLL2